MRLMTHPLHKLLRTVAASGTWAAMAIAAALIGLFLSGSAHAAPNCHGKFMNPITDICWSCMFPLTLGSASLVSDGQSDIDNPSSPVCFCANLSIPVQRDQ